ncbi:pilus assembly protein PilM [Lampropedia hyalina]|uniref:pilus assembly protein PilM n=1 Tax=Lampropedia hyalina TaxID=198706 RepID=UPI00093313ED|nr:pilus assembly protein PilM [Lampropedia hyalina]
MVSVRSLFSKRQPPLLGIDISASNIKLVELGGNPDGKLVLERCAIERLELGWVSEGNIENFDEVSAALRRLVQKSGTRTKRAALALPSSAVITKRIMLPAGLLEEDMELQVESEASHYIPFALDEVSLDFCVVGDAKTSVDDVEVLIAASRKDRVQDRQGIAEAAGLQAVILDIESYAARSAVQRLSQTWPNTTQDSILALFELGANISSLQVLQGQDVLYEREQSFGGQQLTNAIARHYGISAEEAETQKRNGDMPEDYEKAVLQPFIATLTQEITRSLQFFYTSTPHNKVDRILLAGGTSTIAGIAASVTQAVGTVCQVANPFEGMDMGRSAHMKTVMRDAPIYLTACGLALRRFDQ